MRAPGYSALAVFRRVLAIARPFWFHIAGVLLLSLLATPVALLTPLPLKIVADNVVGGRPLPTWLTVLMPQVLVGSAPDALVAAVVVFIIVALLSQLQVLGSWALQTYTGEQLLLRFRAQLFAHVQRLSFAYHDARGSADSLYRIQYDSQAIQILAINGIVPFVTSGVTLAAMLVVTARIDRMFAAIAAAVIPLLVLLVRASRARLLSQWEDIKRDESAAVSVVQEVLGALRVVKAFGQEDREQQRYVERSSRTTHGQVTLALTQGSFDVVVGLTVAGGMGVALYLGAVQVQAGSLSLGELIVVMAYMAQVLAPVESITKRIGQIQGAVAGAARAFALLDEQPDVSERPHATPIARARGAFSWRRVSFAYEPGQPVLRNISFEVAPGSRVGIAGRTGAGKTTLVNLLTRFYDPVEGAIFLDGQDLREYRLSDLRRQFAIVLQEPVLFSTSLGENIAYARPEATLNEIVAASKAASAHEFIAALPEGYDTQVGERGLRLSGGERQRISLARAFLKDAPILILDEPTSSVDTQTEEAIMEAMHRLMAGRTTFIIAHRISTLEGCDVRLVLDSGQLVGSARADAPVG